MDKKHTIEEVTAMSDKLFAKIAGQNLSFEELAQDPEFIVLFAAMMEQDADDIMLMLGKASMEADGMSIDDLLDGLIK